MKKTYSIKPQVVTKGMVDFEFDIRKYNELVVPGNWDKKLVAFELGQSGTLLRSLEALDSGAKWEDTEYWAFLVSSLSEGVVHCGVKNMRQLHARCYGFIDGLVAAARKANRIPVKYDKHDQIGVSIGRDGQVILNNGRHRMCIAKHLDLPSIPVCINVRHRQWVNFKSRIREYTQGAEGHVYAPLRHFDLREFSSVHTGRVELIHSHIDPTCRTVLDIGAHWGSHSIYLAKQGLTCTAVESSSKALVFLRRFIRISGQSVRVFGKSVFALPTAKFSVVLALRIFHHFLKDKKKFTALVSLLRRLDARELYFQPHDKKKQHMPNAYRNFDEAEFVQFILDNSRFVSAKQIGKMAGGPIFRFHR